MNIKMQEKIREDLSLFVEDFILELNHQSMRQCCKSYLAGLILEGDRKSIQPISQKVSGANYESLQNFINDSPWDHRQVLKILRKKVLKELKLNPNILLLDDTSFPKKGKSSVGVARQYCGATGKIDNCQCLVTWSIADGSFHIPVTAQLYLPENWTCDKNKMAKAHIPDSYQVFKEKWRIALDLLDEIDDIHSSVLIFDSAYGSNRKFLNELDQRSLKFVGQVSEAETFWSSSVPLDKDKIHSSGRGAPRKHIQSGDKRYMPKSAKEWGRYLFSQKSKIKKTSIPLARPKKVEYVSMRVFEAIARPFHTVGTERWLIIEKLSNGELKYYVSNFEKNKSPKEILKLGHNRWKIEQNYQQLKEELGLDHFEGRSWPGFHHHVTICFMAFDFLQILRKRQKKNKDPSTNEGIGKPSNPNN